MKRTTSLPGPGTLAAVLSALAVTTHAYNFTQLPSPNLDLSPLGQVAVVGDFDSISIAQYQEQSQAGFSTNGSQSVLGRYPDGAFAALAASDGIIQTMCPFISNGEFAGIIVGGNFTSLGGLAAQGAALFNPNTSEITPLPGLTGSVSSVYCDAEASAVFFGGSFSGGNSTNAIAWYTGWTNLPFEGFNGPVNSVTKGPDGNIIFAGSFDGLGNVSTPTQENAQVINIGTSDLTTSGNSSQSGFSDPLNIVCKDYLQQGSGQTWLLPDNSPGYWDAKFGFGFIPTVLRLWNTNYEGRGTKSFRMIALPLNGIMNLTYIDSAGTEQSCTAECPLPQGDTSAQNFTLVNSVGMNEFRIEFNDWYGDGAGLNGIELLQSDLYSFAVKKFNEPSCDGTGIAAEATHTGPWTHTPSGQSDSDYLTASLDSGSITSDSAQVVFLPDIKEPGNYSITMYTPGCIGDNTCSSRGSANVTGQLSANGATFTATVTQTNDYDKYDQIYYGPVGETTSSFRPSVTLSPMSGQNAPLTLVAQRIRFVLVDSTGGLNGVFEYDINQATVNTDFSSSAIDSAGMALDTGATINTLAVVGNDLYIGGNFSSGGSISGLNNIFSVGSNNATAMPNGGLNNAVEVIYQNGSTLYVGGNFTSTNDGSVKDLNGVAVFSASNNAWSALGTGVDGSVSAIVPLQVNTSTGDSQEAIAVSGSFSSVNAFGQNSSFSAGGIAIWMLSAGNWLANIESGQSNMQGALNAYTAVPNGSPLWGGSVMSQEMGTSDAVSLYGNGSPSLIPLGASIGSNSAADQTEASTMYAGNFSGAVTGLFVQSGSVNATAIGGRFAANTTKGTIYNFAVFNGGSSSNVTGFPSTINANSTVLAMDNMNAMLYVGGAIQGTSGSNTVGGFVVYDLSADALVSTQPPALSGGNATVYSIAVQPGTSNVYVGGNFLQAGSLSCSTLCMWDGNTAQWMGTGSGLSGTVTSMVWVSNTKLVLAGNLTADGNQTSIVNYDSSTQSFTTFPGAFALPGPVTEVTPATDDYTQFWAVGTYPNNGSTYVQHYNGQGWTAISGYGSNSVIRSAQVISTTSSHGSSTVLDKNEVLLLTGTINVPGFGNASAVLFNGTDFQPFLLSNTADNGQGSIARMFVQYPGNFMSSTEHHIARGFIVLIGLAIALGLMFIIITAGVLMERYRRKRDGYVPIKQLSADQQANFGKIPPEKLFGGINEKSAMAPKI